MTDPRDALLGPAEDETELSPAPLAGTRAETIQRLQVGLSGLAVVVLVVGLATIITERRAETDATTVPEAAATVAAEPSPTPVSDPLAEAGVVPELPPEPTATPAGTNMLPDTGDVPANGPAN